MPELPEVETVRLGLQRGLAGRTVRDVSVRHPRAVRRHVAGGDDFAANDPRFSDFESWLANLAEPSASGDADPARTLATRPGTYSAGGAVAAVAARFEGRGVRTVAPDPPVSATVVIVPVAGGDDLPGTDGLRAALERVGWARASADGLGPTLKPGVMAALHSLWKAVTS